WPSGRRSTYVPGQSEDAPELLQKLLAINGVRSVFRTADFIALDRKPGADWQRILGDARELFAAAGGDASGDAAGAQASGPDGAAAYGEARVLVQSYRGIPMQVRVRVNDQE